MAVAASCDDVARYTPGQPLPTSVPAWHSQIACWECLAAASAGLSPQGHGRLVPAKVAGSEPAGRQPPTGVDMAPRL